MDEWLSLPRIARKLDMPESSARRYVATLASFLPQRMAGRLVLFHAPTAERVLIRAAELFTQGLRLARVKERLSQEMPGSELAVTGESSESPTASPPPATESVAASFMEAVNIVRQDMAVMNSALERVQAELRDERTARTELARENVAMMQKMLVLEAELVRLRKDRREMEKYLLGKITITTPK